MELPLFSSSIVRKRALWCPYGCSKYMYKIIPGLNRVIDDVWTRKCFGLWPNVYRVLPGSSWWKQTIVFQVDCCFDQIKSNRQCQLLRKKWLKRRRLFDRISLLSIWWWMQCEGRFWRWHAHLGSSQSHWRRLHLFYIYRQNDNDNIFVDTY